MSDAPDLVLAAGGTGGHIYPALAVGKLAQARGMRVAFIGQAGGMEARLVPPSGIEFHGVSAGKWDRGRPRPGQAIAAAGGVVEAWTLVRRWRKTLRAVVGFGGFASFPGAFAATRCGVPLVLHEGNAYPSLVNRWLSARAALVITVQEEALGHLKGVKRSRVIPYPVEERKLDRAVARAHYGLPEDALVALVMGGSQGSAALNREVPAAYAKLLEAAGDDPTVERLHVLHSAGHANVESVKLQTTAQQISLPRYHVHEYLDATIAWSVADLGITRAGIGTLASAAYHGVPLVTVPLPSSAEGHQLHNARAAQAAGAATVVEESEFDKLPEAWLRLLQPEALAAGKAAAQARSPAGAAERILEALMEVM
ncbi:MAG: UDP-N-acetylglucosamine--N-acetylmuramyl-(pentapeptide) pyrophosphoryl-undecaprenol N-acetylglucosamine transferase [Trueperaceae bacterium]|nr:UDP-N-acetylglucosamine--N-acetylmuramyl-(pentapeptide) pyrophosphoryl-undecaprenol N-acetylglucosamine transferase [Trueperaceae bacterium]